MITSILRGGLGNQMFQIAAAINLAIENKEAFAFDEVTWGERGGAGIHCFEVRNPREYKDTIYKKIPFTDFRSYVFDSLGSRAMPGFAAVYQEPFFHYKKIDYQPNLVLEGYFQSEKYFRNNKDIIRKVFFPFHIKRNEFLNKYNVHDSQIVGVHVRRGSFVKDFTNHPPCTVDYYKKAMSNFKDVKFLFVSDDIDWCKENFEGHLYSQNTNDIDDIYDLIMCDHNIISNSTFSWWAAWLNDNENKKVFVPSIWFGPELAKLISSTDDLIPEGWITIK